jgi:hypothetical protein
MAEQYYIQAGVRRAVAALRAGRVDIPAIIDPGGQPGIRTRVRLDQLHSPKTSIPRDHRYIVDVESKTAVLRTEPPAIELEPLGAPGQTASVPLAQVVLT